jgi:hypothetical protein
MITKKDLENRISKLPQQQQSRYKTVDGQKQILDIMALEDVFFQKGKDMGLLTDPGVMEKINAARDQILIQEYYKRNVTDAVKLSEPEKQEYYHKNLKDFYVPPTVTIKYMQLADSINADKAMMELNGGASFDTVAAHFSINKYTRGMNGTIKNIRLNGNIPGVGKDIELEEIISNAQVDTSAIIGPNSTATGWSIIKVIEREDGKQRSYLDAEAEIDQRLRPKKEQDFLTKIVDNLKKQYNVVMDSTAIAQINLRELDKNKENENKTVVTSSVPELNMTVKNVLDRFGKMSQQEQMMYIKGSGAYQVANQDIMRNLLGKAATEDKSMQGFLDTNEDYQQTIRYAVIQEAYKKLVVDVVKVSPEDARAYYDTHLDAFTTPSARKILAIWTKDEKTAKKIYSKFVKAAKKDNRKVIADLIKKYSVNPERDTIDNIYSNGLIPQVGPDQALNDLVWNTPVGSVSPITKTIKNDVLIFRVIEQREPKVAGYTDSEARIMAQLKRDKEKTQMETVKEQLNTLYGLKKYPDKLEIKLSADELFNLADESSRSRKFSDTIIYYDQIIKYYPNGKDDYKASFMKAFLVTEDMGEKEQGLQLFKEFLKKYPSVWSEEKQANVPGELNESAQYMIDELEGKHQQMEDFQSDENNK